MDWFNLGITVALLILSGALAWGKVGTKIALTSQKLSEVDERLERLEINHLPHIQTDITGIKLSLTRIEEHLKNNKP